MPKTHPETRPAAVAGSFYPSDEVVLAREVDDLLERQATTDRSAGPPKAIIVPHAGYIYSGPAAAAAFARLSPGRITRVIMLAPSHTSYFEGIAAPMAKRFETPLGELAVDCESIGQAKTLSFVIESDEAHAREHAIEVELPFLQQTLGDVAIAPFVIGRSAADEVAQLLRLLWGGEETLILISSDLSHYHPYEFAQRIDARTAALIEARAQEDLSAEKACGHKGIQGLLLEARRRGMRIKRLALENSGDTAGGKDVVVGYGAWGLWEK